MSKLLEKDLYYVAVKAFLRDGNKLLITKDIFGDWDLPGGRIRQTEFNTSLEDVLHRKIGEELGADIKYKVGKPVVFMRHQRKEASKGNTIVRIFAVAYECMYTSGKVQLGGHHEKMEWVDMRSFYPEDYFSGGWLKGVQEYQKLAK